MSCFVQSGSPFYHRPLMYVQADPPLVRNVENALQTV